MRNEILMPCTEWAEKLAARHPEDISPSDRITLNNHIASCEACAAVHAAYREMEINICGLPTTSLPGLPYERLRRKDRSIMPSLFSFQAQFDLIAQSKPQTVPVFVPPARSTSIKQYLFYHAIVAFLALIVIVGVMGLSISPQSIASKFSATTSAPSALAGVSSSVNSTLPGTRHINSLILTLYRLCPGSLYSPAPQKVDPDRQKMRRKNPACRALQAGK